MIKYSYVMFLATGMTIGALFAHLLTSNIIITITQLATIWSVPLILYFVKED